MQEVSGVHLTDLDGVARLPSDGMALNQGLSFFLRKSFAPQIQTIAPRVERRMCIRLPVARASRWPMVSGLTQSDARLASRWIAVFRNMPIGCLCVRHPQFQNEVIGG